MPKSVFRLSVFLCCLCLSTSAFATKESGGGNVTANGDLAEFSLNDGAQVLAPELVLATIEPFLSRVRAELPLLAEDLTYVLGDYYLEAKPLKAAGCSFKSVVPVAATTVACQTYAAPHAPEIRISMAYWQTATPSQKSDLILHERLRAIQFVSNRSSEDNLFRAVQAFKKLMAIPLSESSSESSIRVLRGSLNADGFGYYLLTSEIAAIERLAHGQLCEVPGYLASLQASKENFVKDDGLLALDYVVKQGALSPQSFCETPDLFTQSSLTSWQEHSSYSPPAP